MRNKVFALVGGLTTLLAPAVCCAIPFLGRTITGSGHVVSEEQDAADFDQVGVSHTFAVKVSRADVFKVVIHADDNLLEHVRVAKQGRTLLIGLKRNRRYNLRRATLRAEVTMPALTGIRLSGASDGTITDFASSEPLAVDLSGASRLRGDAEAGETHFHLSGASQATVTGSAQDLAIKGSGASQCDLSAFEVVHAEIDLSGASAAKVKPSGELHARLSGASSVTYAGSPSAVEMKTSGASSVKRT